jgi:hypothetical protein
VVAALGKESPLEQRGGRVFNTAGAMDSYLVKPFKMALHLSSKSCSMFAVCKILGTSIRRIWNHINLKIAFVYLLGESVTYRAGSQCAISRWGGRATYMTQRPPRA